MRRRKRRSTLPLKRRWMEECAIVKEEKETEECATIEEQDKEEGWHTRKKKREEQGEFFHSNSNKTSAALTPPCPCLRS